MKGGLPDLSLSKILEKYHASVKELDATLGTFMHQAIEINKHLVEYKTKFDAAHKANLDYGHFMGNLLTQTQGLETDGIAQLNDVKHLLELAATHSRQPHPIKAEEITALAKNPHASAPVWAAFVKSATEINGKLAEFEHRFAEVVKAGSDYSKHVNEASHAANSLNTHGIVQLDELKKLLVLASENPHDPKPIDINEAKELYEHAASQIEAKCRQKIDKYLEQNALSWPTEIKPGMVFRNKRTHDVIEITHSTDIAKAKAFPGFKAKHLKDFSGTPSEGIVTGGVLTAANWVLVKAD